MSTHDTQLRLPIVILLLVITGIIVFLLLYSEFNKNLSLELGGSKNDRIITEQDVLLPKSEQLSGINKTEIGSNMQDSLLLETDSTHNEALSEVSFDSLGEEDQYKRVTREFIQLKSQLKKKGYDLQAPKN